MAAKKTYTIGLSKIEVGAIAEDGGMGETLDVLGYTYQDTCTMTQEDPETDNGTYAYPNVTSYNFGVSISF